jgi:hypothetical protein
LWIFILDANPLLVFAHPEAYFRVAEKPCEFQPGVVPNPYSHKTNWRDNDNKETLANVLWRGGPGAEETWKNRTWPMMLDAVRAAVLATADLSLGPQVHGRPRRKCPPTFELFGLDFALDDEWKPWLLEVNRSPAMLDETKIDELLHFADEATESMLAMALSYHENALEIPSVEDLERIEAPQACEAERVFPWKLLETQNSSEWCYGREIMQIPQCLVCGHSLGGLCGRWVLVLRTHERHEKLLERRSKDIWDKWISDFQEVSGKASHLGQESKLS